MTLLPLPQVTAAGLGMFLLSCLPLLVVPGGGFALLVRWSLRSGRRGGAQVALGSLAALVVQLLLAMGMLVAVVDRTNLAGPGSEVVGGGVLVVLGALSVSRGLAAGPSAETAPPSRTGATPAAAQAFGLGVLNPKGVVVYGVLAPRYLPPDAGAADLLVLGVAYAALVGVWLLVLVAGLGAVTERARPGLRRRVEALCGVVLVAYGVAWAAPAAGRLLGVA